MTLGPITFLAPLVLLGLLALPLIWWLFKVTPPAPKQQVFPPLRILTGVETDEQTPDATPLWLLLLRLLMIALLCIGLAKPVIDRAQADAGSELTLVIDDSWAGAAAWSDIIGEADALLNQARRDNVPVRLLTTIAKTEVSEFGPAQVALDRLDTLSPQPFAPRFDATLTEANYLSGGFGDVPKTVRTFAPVPDARAVILDAPEEMAEGFRVALYRAGTRGSLTQDVAALGSNGAVLATTPAEFRDGANRAEAVFDLPSEIRNRVARLQVQGVRSAAAVRLLDDSWGRPVIGVLDTVRDSATPLLSEPFYARTALGPYADIYDGSLEDLLPLSPSILVMPDQARTTDPRLKAWVESGGLLIRFAGEKLAERPDDLIPVALRIGGRALGGALTWEEPQTLAPFQNRSPFSGLDIPEDIFITRQVMADPGAETDARTWASLTDGSPVVTTDVLGQGRIILFHVTAGPEWSNLAVSGLYVEMLKRLLPMAKAPASVSTTDVEGAEFAPERIMDGFGQLGAAGLGVKSVTAGQSPTMDSPPGLYRQGTRRLAVNAVTDPDATGQALSALSGTLAYGRTEDRNLGGQLLALAALLLAIDVIFSMIATGRRPRLPRGLAKMGAGFALMAALMPADSFAQDAPSAALDLYLAYVVTDDRRLDSLSEQALEGVAKDLNSRTTIHPEGVVAVVPGVDVLDYYPFLFYPVRRDSGPIDSAASAALNAYMAGGGTIVFDTADFAEQGISSGAHPGLAAVTADLDMPKLVSLPDDHVLTKSFYLMKVFPGRFANGTLWVEDPAQGRARDGVTSVIVGSNDWAAAWAVADDGTPVLSLENDVPRQREMARRFGINLGMYTLAGNYKSDQVHTARLVERLGIRAGDVARPGERNDETVDEDGEPEE